MMKYDYTLGLYEKAMPSGLSWEEKLIEAKTSGYDFVEISIDETQEKLSRLKMSTQERLELAATMKSIGVPIRTMCLSGHRKYPIGSSHPEICERGMEIMEQAIELADDLGIRIIQLAGYDVYYEKSSQETVKRFEDNLKKAVLMAGRAGVLLGFETMETEFMNTVKKAMYYVHQVNSPYLGVYPDVGNITNAAVSMKKNVLQDIQTGEGHIVAVHLKETVPGKFREIPFGTGHVDFSAAVEKCRELGVRKYVAEFWYTGNPEWRQELQKTAEMMREIL